jgi:hypothetical protein
MTFTLSSLQLRAHIWFFIVHNTRKTVVGGSCQTLRPVYPTYVTQTGGSGREAAQSAAASPGCGVFRRGDQSLLHQLLMLQRIMQTAVWRLSPTSRDQQNTATHCVVQGVMHIEEGCITLTDNTVITAVYRL